MSLYGVGRVREIHTANTVNERLNFSNVWVFVVSFTLRPFLTWPNLLHILSTGWVVPVAAFLLLIFQYFDWLTAFHLELLQAILFIAVKLSAPVFLATCFFPDIAPSKMFSTNSLCLIIWPIHKWRLFFKIFKSDLSCFALWKKSYFILSVHFIFNRSCSRPSEKWRICIFARNRTAISRS
jgi:hypothetical protein